MSEMESNTEEKQRQKDAEHLKLLSIFHFILAGISLVMIAFLTLHYFMMSTVFSDPGIWGGQGDKGSGPPPEIFFEFLQLFVWVYLFMGLVALCYCVANVLSDVFLLQRKYRMFSIVVAVLNCIRMPFGTALGAFTLVVLLRESVQEAYGAQADRE